MMYCSFLFTKWLTHGEIWIISLKTAAWGSSVVLMTINRMPTLFSLPQNIFIENQSSISPHGFSASTLSSFSNNTFKTSFTTWRLRCPPVSYHFQTRWNILVHIFFIIYILGSYSPDSKSFPWWLGHTTFSITKFTSATKYSKSIVLNMFVYVIITYHNFTKYQTWTIQYYKHTWPTSL